MDVMLYLLNFTVEFEWDDGITYWFFLLFKKYCIENEEMVVVYSFVSDRLFAG